MRFQLIAAAHGGRRAVAAEGWWAGERMSPIREGCRQLWCARAQATRFHFLPPRRGAVHWRYGATFENPGRDVRKSGPTSATWWATLRCERLPEAFAVPDDAREARLARIDRKQAREHEKQLALAVQADPAGQQRAHSARLAAVDGEEERAVAAHGQMGIGRATGVDVAAFFGDAQAPATAAGAGEVELAGELQRARLFGPEVVRHHAHHGVDVRDADAL